MFVERERGGILYAGGEIWRRVGGRKERTGVPQTSPPDGKGHMRD